MLHVLIKKVLTCWYKSLIDLIAMHEKVVFPSFLYIQIFDKDGIRNCKGCTSPSGTLSSLWAGFFSTLFIILHCYECCSTFSLDKSFMFEMKKVPHMTSSYHGRFNPFTPTDRFRSIQNNDGKSPLKLLSVERVNSFYLNLSLVWLMTYINNFKPNYKDYDILH